MVSLVHQSYAKPFLVEERTWARLLTILDGRSLDLLELTARCAILILWAVSPVEADTHYDQSDVRCRQ